MDIVEEITTEIMDKALMLGTLRAIQQQEGVDLEKAVQIAQERIKAAVFARVNADDFLEFMERPGVDGDDPGWAKEYAAAAEGYQAGYVAGFADGTKLF